MKKFWRMGNDSGEEYVWAGRGPYTLDDQFFVVGDISVPFPVALIVAAADGVPDILQICKDNIKDEDYGKTQDYFSLTSVWKKQFGSPHNIKMSYAAVSGRQLHSNLFDQAMIAAAVGGHEKIVTMCWNWGARTSRRKAKLIATKYGHTALIDFFNEDLKFEYTCASKNFLCGGELGNDEYDISFWLSHTPYEQERLRRSSFYFNCLSTRTKTEYVQYWFYPNQNITFPFLTVCRHRACHFFYRAH